MQNLKLFLFKVSDLYIKRKIETVNKSYGLKLPVQRVRIQFSSSCFQLLSKCFINKFKNILNRKTLQINRQAVFYAVFYAPIFCQLSVTIILYIEGQLYSTHV